jgi:hypothetical protein
MEKRFKFTDGVAFNAFSFTVSLCDAISSGGTQMKQALASFEASSNKPRIIKSVQNLFYIMLDREIGAVCAFPHVDLC